MTRDDIIRLAKEAGFTEWHRMDNPNGEAVIHAFAALVAAAEREACAKVCDREAAAESNPVPFDRCAVLIRARGDQ